MSQYDQLAAKESVDKAIEALKNNGINAYFTENGQKAKDEVLKLIPEGAEVFNETSVTLDIIGMPQEINESGKYNSVRNKLNSMDRSTQSLEMLKLGAAPEWAIGSVHAVTEDGHIIIASQTGSQLSAYAGGAQHIIWVVGIQKIVRDDTEALKRIYEYVLPLESERANKAYNITTGSSVNKLLIVNKEIKPNRITVIFVGEKLGF